jgi:hypothetical protein
MLSSTVKGSGRQDDDHTLICRPFDFTVNLR